MLTATRCLCGIAIALAGGCKKNPAPSASPGAEGVRVPETAPRTSPLPQSKLPTTDASIAIGNFEGQIGSLEKGIKQQPQRAEWLGQLAPLYAMRAQFFGRLSDYDAALELAERAVRIAPSEASSYLLRADARASLHRFTDALADLDAAEQRGARADLLQAMRAGFRLALGQSDEALALRHAQSAARPSLQSYGAEAGMLGDLGRTDEAERLFIEAQFQFHDVSPFPLAWLYFQEGLLWERAGKLGRARELYEAARERLPAYAGATGHLAGVLGATGERDAAIALLRPLVDKSDDPEYLGQLAGLLKESGATDEAQALAERARKRFEALLAKHPEAFSDHAARFYLGAGADPKRALALARRNLGARDTAQARELVLDAALAAGAAGGSPDEACAAAERAIGGCVATRADGGGLARCTPHLHVLASRAFQACHQEGRAADELRAASAN